MELVTPSGNSHFPDMVIYHIKLKCYVVIELKVVDFMPEFIGKLNFYVSAADELLKGDDDNPALASYSAKTKTPLWLNGHYVVSPRRLEWQVTNCKRYMIGQCLRSSNRHWKRNKIYMMTKRFKCNNMRSQSATSSQ